MALHVLKATLTKHALGNTLSLLVDVPLRVGEVRFEQYVQSRPRRFGRSVVDDGGGRFYCALKNEHVERQSLPLSCCQSCPNSSCRSFLLRKGVEGVE